MFPNCSGLCKKNKATDEQNKFPMRCSLVFGISFDLSMFLWIWLFARKKTWGKWKNIAAESGRWRGGQGVSLNLVVFHLFFQMIMSTNHSNSSVSRSSFNLGPSYQNAVQKVIKIAEWSSIFQLHCWIGFAW